jgi:serine/threonine-protein kinase
MGHDQPVTPDPLYEEAFEESQDTMCAADWDANCAHTQAAWSMSDLPPVSPTQEARHWSGEAKVAAVAVTASLTALLVVIVVIMVKMMGDLTPPTTQPTTQTVTAEPPVTRTVTVEPTTQTQTVTVTPPPAAPPVAVPQTSCESSLEQLRGQANIDGPVLSAQAEGRWMPQLSSKRPGTRDDGRVWDCNSIWQEHLRLRHQYEGRLLWSGDWRGTFKQPDYWVTVAGMTYPTANGAQSWCDRYGLDSDHCFPTLIR